MTSFIATIVGRFGVGARAASGKNEQISRRVAARVAICYDSPPSVQLVRRMNNVRISATVLLLACLSVAHAGTKSQPISLAAFSDGIKHWQDRHGTAYARHQPEQVTEIADNLLLYQRDNGAWIENRDPARILDAREKAALVAEKAQPGGSFDNRNIYSQIEYLAAAFGQTRKPAYRDAAARGLDYALSHQIAGCGGWPHSVPGTASYHRYITIADEVTSGMLRLLRKISSGADPFDYIDPATRARAQGALERGH
jgi:hypothetical protein